MLTPALTGDALRAGGITTSLWRPPAGDEDGALTLHLRHEPFLPLFVLGLDPRLCAWLCAALARALPVATLTLHDTLAYPRLLGLIARGELEADRRALEVSLAPRRLSPALPVEHGWFLRRTSGRAHLDRRTLPALREACQKLLRVRPDAQAVALWDRTDPLRAPELAELLPGARFVCLHAGAERVAAAQRRVLLGERPRHLDGLLAGRRPWLARWLPRLTGDRGGGRLLRALAAQRARRARADYHLALLGVPPARRVDVEVEALLHDPVGQLARVGGALGLQRA